MTAGSERGGTKGPAPGFVRKCRQTRLFFFAAGDRRWLGSCLLASRGLLDRRSGRRQSAACETGWAVEQRAGARTAGSLREHRAAPGRPLGVGVSRRQWRRGAAAAPEPGCDAGRGARLPSVEARLAFWSTCRLPAAQGQASRVQSITTELDRSDRAGSGRRWCRSQGRDGAGPGRDGQARERFPVHVPRRQRQGDELRSTEVAAPTGCARGPRGTRLPASSCGIAAYWDGCPGARRCCRSR
jgi:hypothetical protein